MALKVFGLGLGRTGTLSLKMALEELGFGPCYHMHEMIDHPSDANYWTELDKKGETDWDALFGSYQSSTDFPAVAYYHQILSEYPEAKLILTERDPESWYQSASQTILNPTPGIWEKLIMSRKILFNEQNRNRVKVFHLVNKFWKKQMGEQYLEKDHAVAFFKRWNEQIKREFPADRLLVYQVSEGWEPLCSFLNVPVPDIPFPKSNSSKEFKEKKALVNQ